MHPIHSIDLRYAAPVRRWIACAVAVSGALGIPNTQVDAGLQDGSVVASDNHRCLECHGQAHIGELTPRERSVMVAPIEVDVRMFGQAQAPRPELYVGPNPLQYSTHADLLCVNCHADADALPHARVLEPATCNTACHVQAQADFDRSSHAEALASGNPDAPRCASCHGTHGILPVEQRESPTHPFNAVAICGECHKTHAQPLSNGKAPQQQVQSYLDSVHGRAVSASGLVLAATCADCHQYHGVLPASSAGASTHREQIPTTCGRCHLGVTETYQRSIHGRKLAEGDEQAPVCTDCHAGHQITRASTPEALVDIVIECGECHDRAEMSQGRRASFYKTYRASYHGQVTELGSTRAARCSDCHGAHDILPTEDEASRLHPNNLVETCRQCHEGANARFVQFDPHADYLDGDRYPLLHAVWWYFVVVMSLAFGFYGLHSVLWFVRSLIERRKRGRQPRAIANPHGIRRFTLINRVNHALLIIAFFGLTLTGLPLLLSDHGWARALVALLGGGHVVGVLHRIFAALLMANFVLHIFGMIQKARRHRGSLVRDWLIGPNTMLPRLRDVTDCFAMFRWFLLGGRKPTFDRWTYWEKFDYSAEIIGIGIIGGSGLLLWFPEFFSSFMPGWMFNVAMIVHGYEALLAVCFIFTIHFFNAHLRLEKFPVDDVIFTGQVPEEEFKAERADEYARLVETGELDALKVPPAPRWQRNLAVVVGVVAMAIGFTIVALIIMAGLEAL
jgi:cytochrome b subunit of formate dehydrogenase